MIVKIVGVSEIFTFKDKRSGVNRQARNLYIVRKPNPHEVGTIGMISQSIFIPETLLAKVATFDPKKDYNLIYDSDGKYSYLADIQEVI